MQFNFVFKNGEEVVGDFQFPHDTNPKMPLINEFVSLVHDGKRVTGYVEKRAFAFSHFMHEADVVQTVTFYLRGVYKEPIPSS